jgi:hypothetical protein
MKSKEVQNFMRKEGMIYEYIIDKIGPIISLIFMIYFMRKEGNIYEYIDKIGL